MNRFRRWQLESIRVAILLTTVALIWCVMLRKFDRADWQVLPNYAGDALNYAAWAKAAGEGQFLPFAPKFNRYLNAPFEASWNDFPSTEDMLWAATGVGARLFGLFRGLNLFYLLACSLAAASFYLTARYLRYRWQWCMVGALAFGLSPYAYYRGVDHLALTFYWHLPLCLLVTWWAASRKGLPFGGRRFWCAIVVAVITGWQNPYYTCWFLQLLGVGALGHMVWLRKKWTCLVPTASVMAATFLAFFSANADTFVYQAQAGRGSGALIRFYKDLEIYALRPVELFLPNSHRWPAFANLTTKYRADLAMPSNEPSTLGMNEPSYLGMIGAVGFLAMLGQVIWSVLKKRDRPDALALQAFWLIGYSIVGGLNGILGAAGLLLFRGQNRVSIFLLALALFFVVHKLSRLSVRWSPVGRAVVALFLSIVIVWDQWPPISPDSFARTRELMESDKAFARRMEKELPPGGMVFQLPVMRYPEAAKVNGRDLNYEHFRPYLFTNSLRYSYGTDKGRGDEIWQRRVADMSPADQIAALEKYGFAAIFIVRRGYPAMADKLEDELCAQGKRIIVSRNHDLSCILLDPDPQPTLPEPGVPAK